jgi:hypothetical protein
LGLTGEQIRSRLELLNNAQKILSDYRFEVDKLQRVELNREEMVRLEHEILQIRDKLPRGTSLYTAWCVFHQRGLYLGGRAQEVRRAEERRKFWAELAQDTGRPLGQTVGDEAEQVIGLLSAERDELMNRAFGPIRCDRSGYALDLGRLTRVCHLEPVWKSGYITVAPSRIPTGARRADPGDNLGPLFWVNTPIITASDAEGAGA